MSNGTDICSRLIIVFMNYYCSSRLKKALAAQPTNCSFCEKNAIPFSSEALRWTGEISQDSTFFSQVLSLFIQNELLISAMKLHFQAPTINSHLTNYSLYQNSNTSS
jgi:hypothetical protein